MRVQARVCAGKTRLRLLAIAYFLLPAISVAQDEAQAVAQDSAQEYSGNGKQSRTRLRLHHWGCTGTKNRTA